MSHRIQAINQLSQKVTEEIRQEKLEAMWEKLDAEIGMIFQEAEKSLCIPSRVPSQWSPALARTGAMKRYWRIRLQQAQDGVNEAETRKAQTLKLRNDGTGDLWVLQERYESAT